MAKNAQPKKQVKKAKTTAKKVEVKSAKKMTPVKKAVVVKKPGIKAKAKAVKAVKKGVPAKKVAPAKKAVVVKKPVIKAKAKAVKAVKKGVPAKKTAPIKKATAVKETVKAAPGKTVTTKGKTKVDVLEKEVMETVPAERKGPHRVTPLEREIKNILLKSRHDLLKEISENRERESDSLKKEIGDIYDEASNERERELSLLLGDRDRQKLIAIDEALQRIETGTYGICESCGEKVAPGRLKAQLFATLCINCKAEEERQEARRKKFEAEGIYRNLNYGEEEEG